MLELHPSYNNGKSLQYLSTLFTSQEHIESVKKLSGDKGFDVIIGTDVTYVAEYIKLFMKVMKLGPNQHLFCVIFFIELMRPSILSDASDFGFQLVD